MSVAGGRGRGLRRRTPFTVDRHVRSAACQSAASFLPRRAVFVASPPPEAPFFGASRDRLAAATASALGCSGRLAAAGSSGEVQRQQAAAGVVDWCYGVGFQRRQFFVVIAVVGHRCAGGSLLRLLSSARTTGKIGVERAPVGPSIGAVRLVLLLAALTIASGREALASQQRLSCSMLCCSACACLHAHQTAISRRL